MIKDFFLKASKIQLGVAMLSLVGIITINFIEIILRYFANVSILWVQDVSLLLMIWMIFTGASVITYEKSDVVITLLSDKLSNRINKHLDKFISIGLLLFFMIFGYSIILLFISQKNNTMVTTSIPLRLYTLPLLINAVFSVVFYLYENLQNIKNIGRGE